VAHVEINRIERLAQMPFQIVVEAAAVKLADWGTLKMSEVAIQEWSNGKVVREKFVY
jgi:hypothetical protein